MWFRKEKTELDKAIDAIHVSMREYGPESPEYPHLVKHLESLTKLKHETSRRVTPDMVLLVAGNLLGIVVIVAYEKKDVFASAAKNFVLRTR